MQSAPHSVTLFLSDAEATERLAQWFAERLAPGDTLLLEGPIGAGKTHFARAFIRARLGNPSEDVPSPTFTLVQVYDAGDAEIWHTDLYRLTHPEEALELGLEDAFHTAICLVEWPDRLAELAPPSALHLRFDPTRDDGRVMTIGASDPRWSPLLDALPPRSPHD